MSEKDDFHYSFAEANKEVFAQRREQLNILGVAAIGASASLGEGAGKWDPAIYFVVFLALFFVVHYASALSGPLRIVEEIGKRSEDDKRAIYRFAYPLREIWLFTPYFVGMALLAWRMWMANT